MACDRTAAAADVVETVDWERFTQHHARSSFYPYPGLGDAPEVRAVERRGAVRQTEVCFQSPLPSGVLRNDVVTVRLFEREAPGSVLRGRPLVFLHGLGARKLAWWDCLPRNMAACGFPTVLVGIPYVCERKPVGMRAGYPYMCTAASRALPAYEQAVADVRASLDWLDSRGLGDGAVIAGVSMGALIAVIAAALERRFTGVVPILGGGDLDVIVFDGYFRKTILDELRDASVSLEGRRRARSVYGAYLDRVRRAGHPLSVHAPFHYFLFDPLTFASHLRTLPAAMVNARFDPVIPRAAAIALWRELGSPPIYWFRGTHWAGGPWKRAVVRILSAFLSGIAESPRREPADSWASLRMP